MASNSSCEPSREIVLNSRNLIITALVPDQHAEALWPILSDSQENQRLFQQVYGTTCLNVETFKAILGRVKDKQLTYSLVERSTLNAVGWIVLHSFTLGQHDMMKFAFFRPGLQFDEYEAEALYALHSYLFDDLGYRALEYRMGTMIKPRGMTFAGAIRYQLFIPKESQFSDCYVMKMDQWPVIKCAAAAWLGDRVEETGGEEEKV